MRSFQVAVISDPSSVPTISLRFTAPVLCWLAVLAGIASADEVEVDASETAPIEREMQAAVERFSLYSSPLRASKLVPVKAMRWDSPERGTGTSGFTYLYVHQGQPLAACCIYSRDGLVNFEFGTLTRGTVVGDLDGTVFWEPQRPGVTFVPVPESPEPASSRAARLLQMKELTRRFGSTMLGWRAGDDGQQELRLLPRPVYRYEQAQDQVIDGAVFTFSMGVDPESFLILEAVRTPVGMRWEYAFHRRTTAAVEGRLDGKPVWSVEAYPPGRNPKSNFRTIGLLIPNRMN